MKEAVRTMCQECYADDSRITPLLGALECLERASYKIFACSEDMQAYLRKNKDKMSRQTQPLYTAGEFREYPKTEVRRLTSDEIRTYMSEREHPD